MRFQFQSVKKSGGHGSLPAAVQETLARFQRACVNNLRGGAGSVVLTVTEPEEGVYFAVVLAGPCTDLSTLQGALLQASDDMIGHLNRVGLK